MGRIKFLDEIASGDQRRALEAVRERLAVALDQAEGSHVAPLAREMQAVLKALAALPVERKATIADELARRRQDGEPKPAVLDGPAVPVKRKGAQRRRTGT